jgi:hypothetical protein
MSTLTAINGSDEDDDNYYRAEATTAASEPSAKTQAAKSITCVIRFYVLRHADPNENWKVQAVFGEKIKYEFEKTDMFVSAQVSRFI